MQSSKQPFSTSSMKLGTGPEISLRSRDPIGDALAVQTPSDL